MVNASYPAKHKLKKARRLENTKDDNRDFIWYILQQQDKFELSWVARLALQLHKACHQFTFDRKHGKPTALFAYATSVAEGCAVRLAYQYIIVNRLAYWLIDNIDQLIETQKHRNAQDQIARAQHPALQSRAFEIDNRPHFETVYEVSRLCVSLSGYG
jgi:hypothetical protein